MDPDFTTLQAPPDELARLLRAPENEGVLLSGRLGTQPIPTGVGALFDLTQVYEPVIAR